MTDVLSYIGSWSIWKWIVLVLVAGFIGQFGKMAAEAIAARIRARRETKESSLDMSTIAPASQPSSTNEIPDKKNLKAVAKAKKKEAKKKPSLLG